MQIKYNFFAGRFSVSVCLKHLSQLLIFCDLMKHVRRYANCAAGRLDIPKTAAAYRLCCISREFRPVSLFKMVCCIHEREISLLHQIVNFGIGLIFLADFINQSPILGIERSGGGVLRISVLNDCYQFLVCHGSSFLLRSVKW